MRKRLIASIAIIASFAHLALPALGLNNGGNDYSSNEAPTRLQAKSSLHTELLPSNAPQSAAMSISAAWGHTCTLTTSGGVKCWGWNGYGQLGDGTTVDRLTPVDVVGLTSGVAGVVAQGAHTCALTVAGGVKCWGENTLGELGDGTTIERHTPVDVSGLTSGVTSLTAGTGHTCAVTRITSVKCWGGNAVGQLGDGTTTNRLSPVTVVGLSDGAAALSAGMNHTCALTTNGGIKCWGDNDYGQLGDGTTTDRLTPIPVAGLTSGVQAVTAGYFGHTCALTNGGGVKCWGGNGNGKLGDGTIIDRLTPVTVSGFASGATAVSAGWDHTCALTNGGGVKCWGYNGQGQLGDGTNIERHTPVSVNGQSGMTGVAALEAGVYHNCLLTTRGGAKCWGDNYYGQLGDGAIGTNRNVPVEVVGLSGAPACPTHGINLTISLYRSAHMLDRAVYTHILEYFGDAVYEASNGAHQICDITIFQNGAKSDMANILWNANEWPRAHVAGYNHVGWHVWMGDIFAFPTPINVLLESNWRGAGYALGHEWGHYYYGLYDEYQGSAADNASPGEPRASDQPVPNSVMNNSWNAIVDNFNWLNFSVPKYDTHQTAQFRMYQASGWTTLARPNSQDPRGGNLSQSPIRTYYPELTGVAPGLNQDSSLELPTGQSQARSALRITWVGGSTILNANQLSAGYDAVLQSIPTDTISYPQPVILVAWVNAGDPIARSGINSSLQLPDNALVNLDLRDDGAPPDRLSNDGLYSGFMPYQQNGPHTITVTFNNDAGTAEYTQASAAHAIGPNGDTYSPTMQLVGENFSVVVTSTVVITNVMADDHGDTPPTATTLLPDNVDVPGRIDRASDVDVFKVTPSQAGTLVMRVSNLALGMQPKIRLLKADGVTVIGAFDFQSQANTYFFTRLAANAYEPFYAEISHHDGNATTGMYYVSVGDPITAEYLGVYLPLSIRNP